MEGPVLVVDNQGTGRQIVPINGTCSLSWKTFNFGVTCSIIQLHPVMV